MVENSDNQFRAYEEKGAAKYVGLSVSTLRQSRCHGKKQGHTPTPKFIRIGRAIRYLREDLDAFLDEMRERSNGSQGRG